MRYYIPDPIDSYGGSSSKVPSVMDNDPRADEEIIDQQAGEQYPKAVEQTGKIAPDELADSIAYAIDGSGPGLTGDTPNVSGHKTITEGVTGASLDEEEDALKGQSS
ncbi:hypothetical protein [Spirosoma oryzicola]|uniref:hypothetical protein n=1 Tax=Spirosoma oryzicola TaxID=2898794 RepID=UPI001E628B37|nr:hypothetical protein [Spirosoma oryzicola]UHG89117.1 hypothetical protein LQ777_12765 [Spirosoma oryzicola]